MIEDGSKRAFYKEFVRVVEAADVVIQVLPPPLRLLALPRVPSLLTSIPQLWRVYPSPPVPLPSIPWP